MLLHRERGLGCALQLSMEIQPLGCCFDGCVLRLHLLVASVAGSPAGGRDGAFLTLDLVVRCSSTSGAVIEFWRPGNLCWSPVPSTLRRLENLSVFLGFSRLWIRFSSSHCRSLLHWRRLSVFRLASAVDCCLSGLWASDCGLPRRRRIHARVWFSPVFLSFGSGGQRRLGTLDALCIGRNLSRSILASSKLSLLWVFSGLVQVLSCLALSVPVGVRSVLSPAGFSSLWLCLVERI